MLETLIDQILNDEPPVEWFDAEPPDLSLVLPDVPVDPIGDEASIAAARTRTAIRIEHPAVFSQAAAEHRVVVPFPTRPLHKGMHNPEVRALQRALQKAGERSHPPSGEFGRPTRRQVIRFQRHHGIRNNRGVVHLNTWQHLYPYFDGYDKWLVEHYHPAALQTATKIDHLVKVAWWYYYHRPLYYLQQRPMEDTAAPPNVDTSLDCSEFATVCSHAAGLPDPNGMGYDWWGNTDSMLGHMPHASGPAKGNFAFYSNPSHVAIIVGTSNGTWMTIEMGSTGAPYYVPMSYRPVTAYRTFHGLAGV